MGIFIDYSECDKEYDEPDDDIQDDIIPDVEYDYCPHCAGSGEGMWDGSRCHYCKGMGELPYRKRN